MILDIHKETIKVPVNEDSALNEYSLAALFRTYKKEPTKQAIKKINMIPDNANICKIYSDGSSVYANARFYVGDIIEVCPTREIMKSALYDSDVRQIVFEVKKGEQFVIPFGYCQYYDLSDDMNMPNCSYIWDPNTKAIVIKAITNIQKTEKLILDSGK